MSAKQFPDFLSEFTKTEIIQWIKENLHYKHPSYADFLFIRWSKQAHDNQEANRIHMEKGDTFNMKERDRLAKRFNLSKDNDERLSLIKQMEVIEKPFHEWMSEGKKLREKEKKTDLLYEKLEKAREVAA